MQNLLHSYDQFIKTHPDLFENPTGNLSALGNSVWKSRVFRLSWFLYSSFFGIAASKMRTSN
jgi:hypothetical protein